MEVILSKALTVYKRIKSVGDLKNNNLSVSELQAIGRAIEILDKTRQTETLFKGVKNFFEANGLKIKEHGSGWIISL